MKVRGVFIIVVLAVAGLAAYLVISHSFRSGDVSRSMEFEYAVKVFNIPENAEQVSLLMPVPRSDPHQIISDVRIESPYAFTYLTDSQYDNRVVRIDLPKRAPGDFEAKMIVSVNRKNYTALNGSMKDVEPPSDEMRQRYLSPDRLIPLDGAVLEEEKKVVDDNMTDLEKAKAIYDYLVTTMKYDKSGEGWGRGDALYACDAHRGNCTDFHSLFIGMARASGIPARFVMGFPVPENEKRGEIDGYHCWAEFYTDELGWVPVDASEASKHPDKREYYFGNLDQNRIAFSYGRDIDLGIDEIDQPLNYIIYPIVLVDGKLHDDFEKKFTFSDREIERII